MTESVLDASVLSPVLWIAALPLAVQDIALGGIDHGAQHDASWILAHLPPPAGLDLHIACLWPGGTHPKSLQFAGATFHLVPCPRKGRSLLLFQRDVSFFRPLFETLKPKIVHGWGTEDSFGLVARRLSPTRHVIEIQGLTSAGRAFFPRTYRTQLVAVTEYMTLRRAMNIIAESRFALTAAMRLSPRACGVVIEQPLRQAFLKAEPSLTSEPAVLFVGTMRSAKGYLDVIYAFGEAAPEPWHLWMVGSSTGADEARILPAVQAAGIGNRFHHVRHLSDTELVSLMQNSSIFLLPTRIDSGPTALKEAITMGVWPVCYDNSGPGEYIRKYHFGNLARDGDRQSLSAHLREAIRTKPWLNAESRQQLAKRTREDFAAHTVWQKQVQLYSTIVMAEERAKNSESPVSESLPLI